MEFCPTCANLLYDFPPHAHTSATSKVKIKRKKHVTRKKIDPVFSKEDRKNGPQTDGGSCPIAHNVAIYQQAQIRSADEPIMTFYWCLNEKCGKNWREG